MRLGVKDLDFTTTTTVDLLVRKEIAIDIHRHRSGYWTVELKELDGSVVHGRSLSRVRDEIQLAVRRAGRNPTHVKLFESLHLSPDLDQAVADVLRKRQELERENLEAQLALGRLVRVLRDRFRLGVRDTGEILGISAPYAHLLRRAKRGRPRMSRKRR